jgi:hypothetical protein
MLKFRLPQVGRLLHRHRLHLILAIGLAGWITGIIALTWPPHASVDATTKAALRPTATQAPSPTPTPSPSKTPTPSPTPTPKLAARTITSTAGSYPPASSSSFNFGIAAGGSMQTMGYSDILTRLNGMRAIGVTWVRFDIEWSQVQAAGAGDYNWGPYDTLVQAVRASGLHGLAVIDYTPAWARDSACAGSDKCEPASASAYASFATAVAARYAPQGIDTYEIWNEPNITDFWLPSANAALYTQMLKASFSGIEDVAPGATVLTGGAAACGTGNGNLSPADFLSGIYTNGGRGYFTGVADHPYAIPFLPDFNWYWNYFQQISDTTPSVRSVMIANGDAAKKIWLTEYGLPTGGPGSLATSGMSLSEQNDDHDTEALQATAATEAADYYLANRSFIGGLFWYSYQDLSTDQSDTENFYGLLRYDGSPKPAYYALQQAIQSAH